MNLVSVVVATYKREAELKKALESLATQSYSNLEIVLVDDNEDEEWNKRVSEIVHEFKVQFPTIRLNEVVNHLNQGSAKTRNIGIDIANGKYITFLDDDDIYLPDKVKKQVEFMETSDYDYSITDLILYNEEGREIDKRLRSYIKNTSADSLLLYHLKYHMTGTDTMMFKKEYLTQIGGFAPINVGDEFYLMLRAIEGGGKFGYLPGCEIKAYVHTGESSGVSSGEGKIKGENELFDYKKQFFSKLDSSAVRYIKARHYAVLAFAEIRRKKYGAFLKNSFQAFFSSPTACVKILMGVK
ncbi:MAG: glycosyltransferase family 2 protein [Clostridia bacterium]|nr:glycosyltransferase family 2 protein [Clostridia bacterium]